MERAYSPGRTVEAREVMPTRRDAGGPSLRRAPVTPTLRTFSGPGIRPVAAPAKVRRSVRPAAAAMAKGEAFAGHSGGENPMLDDPFPGEAEDVDIDPDADADEQEAMAERRVDLSGVRASVRTGSASGGGSKIRLREGVKPTDTGPRVDENADGSTCQPDKIKPADLTWNVVDKKKHWGVKVTALKTGGQIRVNPTANKPTDPDADENTPNPVDGGNISEDNWKDVRDSLTGYHTRNGGRGPWHDTAASRAHEWAHWRTDWMKNALGTTWPTYRRKIERLKVAKSGAADANAAKVALEPLVNAKLERMRSVAVKKWNKAPDEPGDFFANGYLAGQEVLDGHVKRLNAYVTKKGWNMLGRIKAALTPTPKDTTAAATT